MIEIRIHGRGGQGGVTAAELLAQAAINEGKFAQGFPSFGPERRGAPVTAYIRTDDKRLLIREPIDQPDVVVVMDASLIAMVNVFEGMKKNGTLIVNATESMVEQLQELADQHEVNLATVDASGIAEEVLGVPITNTAMVGAIVKAMNLCSIEALGEPMEERFKRLAEKNIRAMKKAYDETVISKKYTAPCHDDEAPYHIDAMLPYDQLEIGGDVDRAGSSREFFTGNWRTSGRPVTDYDKCIRCGFCWVYCPDIAYSKNAEGYFDWDEKYCKGCAICVVECPKKAITMEKEAI